MYLLKIVEYNRSELRADVLEARGEDGGEAAVAREALGATRGGGGEGADDGAAVRLGSLGDAMGGCNGGVQWEVRNDEHWEMQWEMRK